MKTPVNIYAAYFHEIGTGTQYLYTASNQTDLFTSIAHELDIEQVDYALIRDVFVVKDNVQCCDSEVMLQRYFDKCSSEDHLGV